MAAPSPALEQFLRSIPLFSLVEPSEMLDILRLVRPIELEAGQVLFREGTPGNAMWVLGKGTEISVSTTPTGAKRPVVVAYAKAGDTIGEMALVDDAPRSGTAVVTVGGPAHQIDAMDFQTLRGAHNPAAFKVLRRMCADLCKRLRATRDRIVPSGGNAPPAPEVPRGPRPDVDVLDSFPPFNGLPKVVKLALAQKLQLIEVPGVTPLFGEGEPADGAWFLLDGEVSLGRNGKTLANLGPGSMFGLVSVIDEGRRSASGITTGPARLLRLTDQDFDALWVSGNRFAFTLVDIVARQLVMHLRQANKMLTGPGQAKPARQASPGAVRPVSEEDLLPEAEILPLDLEMELEDIEIASVGSLLTNE